MPQTDSHLSELLAPRSKSRRDQGSADDVHDGEMHDLSDAVQIVSESGVRTGIVQIFNVGSTGAIGAIEFEPGLEQDLPALMRRLIPPVGTTPMSKPGTTAMAIPTCKRRCSVRA